MQAPSGKIAGLAGFVIGLAVCGLSLAAPSGDPITVQGIELGADGTVPNAQPLSPGETAPPTPWFPGGGSPSQTPAPKTSATPTVVAPSVVLERHTAPPRATPPRATPHPTPDDDKDEPDQTDEPDPTDEPNDTDEPDGTDEPDPTDDPGD